MGFRAKFKVWQAVKSDGRTNIQSSAIYGHEGENAEYSKYTPSGNLSIIIDDSTPAANHLQAGDEFYLDFTKIEKTEG